MTAYVRLIIFCLVLNFCKISVVQAQRRLNIKTQDVSLFFKVYDAADAHPTAEQLQRDYFDVGTEGLRTFMRLRGTTAALMAREIADHPEIYVRTRNCAAVLPSVKIRLGFALSRLRKLYPQAKFPPVTIVIGRGKPVGIGSPITGLQIGLEALCNIKYMDENSEDRFVHVIAHEYIHVQQPPEMVDDTIPTVLEASLVEGAAEFIGELISGGVAYAEVASLVRGREAEIETAFVKDEDKRDLSSWLYNGTMEKMGDLGYWVGYRIVKSYYKHMKDKKTAIREIIRMHDPKAFLSMSGWYPGIKL